MKHIYLFEYVIGIEPTQVQLVHTTRMYSLYDMMTPTRTNTSLLLFGMHTHQDEDDVCSF